MQDNRLGGAVEDRWTKAGRAAAGKTFFWPVCCRTWLQRIFGERYLFRVKRFHPDKHWRTPLTETLISIVPTCPHDFVNTSVDDFSDSRASLFFSLLGHTNCIQQVNFPTGPDWDHVGLAGRPRWPRGWGAERRVASFELVCVQIEGVVWAVGFRKKEIHTNILRRFISCPRARGDNIWLVDLTFYIHVFDGWFINTV